MWIPSLGSFFIHCQYSLEMVIQSEGVSGSQGNIMSYLMYKYSVGHRCSLHHHQEYVGRGGAVFKLMMKGSVEAVSVLVVRILVCQTSVGMLHIMSQVL